MSPYEDGADLSAVGRRLAALFQRGGRRGRGLAVLSGRGLFRGVGLHPRVLLQGWLPLSHLPELRGRVGGARPDRKGGETMEKTASSYSRYFNINGLCLISLVVLLNPCMHQLGKFRRQQLRMNKLTNRHHSVLDLGQKG